MIAQVPPYEKVAALPASLTQVITLELADQNGHLNVRHHVSIHDDGGWAFFAQLGFNDETVRERRRNFFDLEHHVRYLAEVQVGARVSVRHRLLDRSDKLVHHMSYLLDDTQGMVASTLEVVTLLVDLDSRLPVVLGSGEAEAIDARLTEDRTRDWDAAAGGVLGVRRNDDDRSVRP